MEFANFFILMFWASLAVHVAFFLFAKKHCRTTSQVFLSSVVLAVSTTGLIGWLLADHYTGEGINDAAIFQLQQGTRGLQNQMLLPIIAFLVGSYFLVVVFSVALHRARKKNQLENSLANQSAPIQKNKTRKWAYALMCFSVLGVNPGWAQTGSVLTIAYFAHLKIENVMENASLPKSPPASLKPLSVVYIYGEGLEATFLNEEAFPGLMPHLNRLAKQALRIHGIKQVPFTGWTIAGQVASNCGFPGAAGTQVFADNSARWPCAANLLAKDNYYMEYLNGSSLDFSSKGDFWAERGYKELYGDENINKIAGYPLKRLSGWGAYDDALMKAAKKEYAKLQQHHKPFVLTMLTVDTHAPYGMGTPSCENDPPYQMPHNQKTPKMLQAAHCADKIIGGFLEDILKDLPDDTIVILQSDHLQPPVADAFDVLEKTRAREDLFLAWGKNITPREITRQATAFDIAPTFLSLLGRDPKALNLGRDLLSDEPTLVERYGYDWIGARMDVAFTDTRMIEFAQIETKRSKQMEMRHNGLSQFLPSKTGDPELKKKLEGKSTK